MKGFSFVLAALAVLGVQGCATHFGEQLPIRDINPPENRRIGIPVFVQTNHEQDVRGRDGAHVEKLFWENFDGFLNQGLANSGFHVVAAGEPYRYAMKISCQMSVWNPQPAIFLENVNGAKILMAMPYMLAGGYFGGEGRMSCDVILSDADSRLVDTQYREQWKDALALSPLALLYMPFKGAFGAFPSPTGDGPGGEKFGEIIAAKMLTNVLADANRGGELYTEKKRQVPVVVVFGGEKK